MAQPLRVLLVGEGPLFGGIAAAARTAAAPQVELSRAKDAASLAQTLGQAPWDLVVVAEPVPGTDATRVQETVAERWPECPVVSANNDSPSDPRVLSPRSQAALMGVLRLALGADRSGPGETETAEIRAFGDGVPLGLFRTTPEGRILDLNQALVDLLAYPSRAALLAENAGDLYVDPVDRERLKQILLHREVLQGHETQFRRHDGRHIWVELSLRACRDRSGAIARFEGAVADVTERKLAEEALWESETRLRLLAEQMPALLWCTDEEPRITLCIGAGLAGLGLRSNQVVGKGLQELFGAQDPAHPALAAHRKALGGESVRFDVVIGGRAFRAYVEPLRQATGGLSGTIGVGLDVTELTQTESAYRDLVESVRAIVWRGDPETFRHSFVSQQAEALLGYPVERWTREPDFWRERIHPDDRERVLEAFRTARREKRHHEIEYRMIAADGRVVWLHDIVRVVPDKGEVKESVGVSVDVTASRRGRAHRAALQGVAEKAHTAESLDDLFAGIHAIVGELMPARNFYIALYDDAAERLTFPYFADEVDPRPAPKPLGRGLTEYVLRGGEAFLATPESFDELRRRGEVDLIGGASVDWLGVPLLAGGRTIGVMVVQSYSDAVRYGEAERDLLVLVSEYVAAAIDRRRAEEALKDTVSLLQSTLEASSDGMLVVDQAGRVVSVNRRFGELWRVPAALLASRESRGLLEHMGTRSRDPGVFTARLRQFRDQPEAESLELLELSDGRTLEWRSTPQRVDGVPVGRLCRFRDVTGGRPDGGG